MFKRSLLVAVMSAALFSSQAFALATPSKSKLDGRIQYVNYSEHNVTKIKAVNGFITTITFAPGEAVSNYGSGYSTAWEFAAADNHFFLKPKDKEATTNIIIVTNRHIYSIDVQLVDDEKSATYQLVYKYPEDEAKLIAQELYDCSVESAKLDERMQKIRSMMNKGESEQILFCWRKGSKYEARKKIFFCGCKRCVISF